MATFFVIRIFPRIDIVYHRAMKILIASDIHGSEKAAKTIVDCFLNNGFDRLVLLGDELYHGPRNDLPATYAPKAVIPLLSSLKDRIVAVRGNCDAEVDQMVLPFPIMDWEKDLIVDGKSWHLSHGHHPETLEKKADVILSGHTHISILKKENGTIYLNPGSPSIPKGGTKAGFAIYDDGVFSLVSLDGSLLSSMAI
jgi:phosphoesterase, MJ0936 family